MFRNLSLRTFVFFWMALAVAVPLVTLLVAATKYSRQQYVNEVHQDIFSSLQRVVSAFDRRIFIERDLIGGLSRVPVVQEYLLVLDDLTRNKKHPGFRLRTERLVRFFETFQGVRRSLGTVRIIDRRGDTLAKISNGQRIEPVLENQDQIPIVENGSEDEVFRKALDELRADDVGALLLPQEFSPLIGVFNTVLPLKYDNKVVGFLVTEAPAGPMDQTLAMAPHPRGASLIVAEINSDDEERDGMLLYSDASDVGLTNPGERFSIYDNLPQLAKQAFFRDEGVIEQEDGSMLFYSQYLPYPDQLLSWAFIFRIDAGHIEAPFLHIRHVIWIGIFTALVIALLMAHYGVRQVTAPVTRLAQRLIGFAKGDRTSRIEPIGPHEMHQACDAFNEMADTLQKAEVERDSALDAVIRNAKLASVGQLAAGIGHELSNPLSNIYSLTKLVQRGIPDDNQVSHDVGLIREEAERASNIIKGLLNFARQGPTDPADFQVVKWIQDGVALVERLAQRRDVTITIEPVKDCELYGDRGLLQQALVNILVNAVQATPRGGEVRVMAECSGETIHINIVDQGEGISSEAAAKIFDPFFTTKPEGEGTGLGLSIAMGILQRHDGEIVLENAPEGGAKASIRMPMKVKSDNE